MIPYVTARARYDYPSDGMYRDNSGAVIDVSGSIGGFNRRSGYIRNNRRVSFELLVHCNSMDIPWYGSVLFRHHGKRRW